MLTAIPTSTPGPYHWCGLKLCPTAIPTSGDFSAGPLIQGTSVPYLYVIVALALLVALLLGVVLGSMRGRRG